MGIAVVHYNDKNENCIDDLYGAIFNINHDGQERCGIALPVDGDFLRFTHNGLVRGLEEKIPKDAKGYFGVGNVSHYPDHQPLIFTSSNLPSFVLTFDGFICNREKLKQEMDGFLSPYDAELAGRIISQASDFEEGIHRLAKKIKGVFCLGLATEEGESYIARCPLATKLLMLGQGEQGYAAITESRAFRKIGMKPMRDFKPGEIVKIDNDGIHYLDLIEGKGRKICSFRWGYFSWVDAVIEGIPVNRVRERVGAVLAERDRKNGIIADRVTAIEDSGKAYGEGYAFQAKLPYFSIAIKYPYGIRSYPRPKGKRRIEAKSKHSTVDDRADGYILVVLDDSLRRGVVTEGGPLDYLRAAGAKKIHLRFGTPRNHYYCRMDYIDAEDSTLPANKYPTDEELAKIFHVDSVSFPTEDEWVNAIIDGSSLTRDDLCLGCYKSGDFSFLK